MKEDKMPERDRRFLNTLRRRISELKKADVIFRKHQHGEAIFYGKDLLRAVTEEKRSREATVLLIEYDSNEESWQLEILCHAVEQVKGRCDYEGRAEPIPDGQHRHGRAVHGERRW